MFVFSWSIVSPCLFYIVTNWVFSNIQIFPFQVVTLSPVLLPFGLPLGMVAILYYSMLGIKQNLMFWVKVIFIPNITVIQGPHRPPQRSGDSVASCFWSLPLNWRPEVRFLQGQQSNMAAFRWCHIRWRNSGDVITGRFHVTSSPWT